MKLQILTIRDIKSDCFPFAPMFVHHIGGAIRDFGDQAQNKENPIGKHPEDYELYHLGEWDDNTAGFEIFERPKQLATGSNYKS